MKLPNGMYKCEYCGKEHNGSYGSGRFCSKQCSKDYISSKNRNAHNPKVKAHLDKLRIEGKVNHPRAPYGTWKCSLCGKIFDTKSKMQTHRKMHLYCKENINLYASSIYQCPFCGKAFDKYQSIGGHIVNCKLNPHKDVYDNAHKQAGKTLSKRIKNGSIIPSFKGKHHSKLSKRKMRQSACNYLKNNNPTPCRYNKSSIPILENIAKEHGWNIQHAENGGEFYTGIGYFVDAYDKEKNIVLEYDEPEHYNDIEHNVLREKDIKRQNEIIEHLHCEFWRYNAAMDVLWKVN